MWGFRPLDYRSSYGSNHGLTLWGFVMGLACQFLMTVNEILHHIRIGQGRNITQLIKLVRGDLSQDPAHDLAGPGLGQCRGKVDDVRGGDGPDFFSDMDFQFSQKFVGRFGADLKGYKGIDALSFNVMGVSNNRGFRHFTVTDQSGFHLSRAHALAGDIDNIIYAAGEQ